MADYLAREGSPLSAEQWERLEKAAVEAARAVLVGRRFIPLFGPLGPGVQVVPADELTGVSEGAVGMALEEAGEVVAGAKRQYLPLPVLAKDFRLEWRDLEAEAQLGLPLDVGRAAAAAFGVAWAEDALIFHGEPDLGLPGLLTAPQRLRSEQGDWSIPGQAYEAVVAALEKLAKADFFGPYALAVSPRLYAALNQVYRDTPYLELERVEKLVRAGVYQSPVLPEKGAVLVAVGAENLDLAVAQDLTIAFLETRSMNHYFRVLESLVLRIKRPQAICTLE